MGRQAVVGNSTRASEADLNGSRLPAPGNVRQSGAYCNFNPSSLLPLTTMIFSPLLTESRAARAAPYMGIPNLVPAETGLSIAKLYCVKKARKRTAMNCPFFVRAHSKTPS